MPLGGPLARLQGRPATPKSPEGQRTHHRASLRLAYRAGPASDILLCAPGP